MLKIAGIHPHPLSNPEAWTKFRQWYSIHGEDDLTQDQATEFRKCIDELRDEVLRKAAVVVSTVNNSGTPSWESRSALP